MPNVITKPSLQSLYIQTRYSGAPIGSGTAFVYSGVRRHYLITNRHNVTGRNQTTNAPMSNNAAIPNEFLVAQNRMGHVGEWVSRVEPILSAAGDPLWIEHPVHGASIDVVALPLTQLHDVQLYPYNEYDSAPAILIGPADPVSVVGFPFGLTGGGALAIWATGFIATEPFVDYDNKPLQLIDCRARPGQSGSPVICYRTGITRMADGGNNMFSGPIVVPIGIYSGRINEQSDLGMVWKFSAIKEIVAAAELIAT